MPGFHGSHLQQPGMLGACWKCSVHAQQHHNRFRLEFCTCGGRERQPAWEPGACSVAAMLMPGFHGSHLQQPGMLGACWKCSVHARQRHNDFASEFCACAGRERQPAWEPGACSVAAMLMPGFHGSHLQQPGMLGACWKCSVHSQQHHNDFA